MVATTDAGTWVVPAGHALWIPSRTMHDVSMHGQVEMRTAYIDETEAAKLHAACRVLKVERLLEAVLVGLSSEPPDYSEGSRGSHLAWLVVDEIKRAAAAPFALPIPQDHRLARLAKELIAKPGATLKIDDWADIVGLSRRTLTRRFRSETGMSFGSWRRKLRLLTAITRLAEKEPIARVAASLGYESAVAFRAMARREFGKNLNDIE